MNTLEQAISEYQGKGDGHHYFDRDTRRFFGSRLAQDGYRAADGSVYFVESVQPPHSRRQYQVCRIESTRNDVTGIGHDGQPEHDCLKRYYSNRATADRAARRFADAVAQSVTL